ncbi:MAG: InlB B-repeat-containing protein [Clostridiales bacterium]|jgi:uncharacterized repeat protein (TIGR02543 family)|nr:InlB B-repeat-containing protein [Clostridiales bacterium]
MSIKLSLKRTCVILLTTAITLSYIFGLSLFSVAGSGKAYAGAEAFDAFSEDVTRIIRDFDAGAPERYNFDIESDLYIQNGAYMISADIFTQRTGSGVLFTADEMTVTGRSATLEMRIGDNMIFADNGEIVISRQPVSKINDAVYFPLADISETLGYSVAYADDSVKLTNPFQTKRLIVKSAREDISARGAIAVADGYDDLHVFQYDTQKQAEDACQYYEALPYVVWAEPDLIFTAQDLEEAPVTANAVPSGYLSWGAANMDVPDYADYLSRIVGQANLRDVVIAVLDTGIDSGHELFAGRIADGGKNFSSQSGTSFQDANGHGSHVSGIIVNLNYANVKVLPIKVMNDKGEGTSTSILQGVSYVISLKDQGMNVYAMNMSLGGEGSSSVYASTVNNAETKGIVSVVAAGNDDKDAAGFTPANVPAAITVAAADSNNNRADFSNWGTTVDIAAPGVSINSAKTGGGYIKYSGTSMAAPHVAAAVALIYSNPRRTLTPEQLKALLYESATGLGSSAYNRPFGCGLVNLTAIIDESLPDVTFGRTTAEFETPFNLSLACEGATEIRYTLDGTEPGTGSTKYAAQIPISAKTTVKAIAYFIEAGSVTKTSKVGTMTYYPQGTVVLVTFDYRGGSGSEATRSVDKDAAIGTLPIPNYRNDYTFNGWFTAASGGTQITESTVITANVTFYAQYTSSVMITILIHVDNSGMSMVRIQAGSALGGLLPNPTKPGFVLLGWETTDGTEVTRNTIFTERTDIWAKWQDTSNCWVVTFDYNGGEGAEAERFVDKGTPIGELPVPYEREDYTFADWRTAKDGGTQVTENTPINGNVTFYAHWTEAAKYLVTFNYNGGSGSESTRPVDKNTAVGALPEPDARDGYTFDGWFTSMSSGTQITADTSITAKVTFYAHWTALPYTITFDSNGGGEVPPIEADCGAAVTAPAAPEKHGFIFGGWYTDNGTFNDPYAFTTMPFDGITLYARWIGIFTVTASVGEGYQIEFEGGNLTSVFAGEIISFKVEIKSGYDGENMLVKNGEAILTAYADGWYIIDSVDADVSITVTGVVKSEREGCAGCGATAAGVSPSAAFAALASVVAAALIIKKRPGEKNPEKKP